MTDNHSPAIDHLISPKSFYLVGAALVGLYFTTWLNYLLFHTLSELFSIIIAFCLFIIVSHTRNHIGNSYLLFIGIAYFFIASLDLLHTLAFTGMPIFTDYDYYANQLWIAARYMESITLLLATLAMSRKSNINYSLVFLTYTTVTTLIVVSIFVIKVFPECFNPETGLTPFKRISEYIICMILILSSYLLYRNRASFNKKIHQILQISILLTIISELAFTFYISNYGLSNLVGHYFKILSFFMIYIAIVKTGLEEPVKVIFHDLEIANQKLKTALDEVKTLQGIIPICSSCKSIRGDKGAWEKLETYIEGNSEAQFSHGVCDACMEKLYGNEEWYKKKKQQTDNN